MFREIERKICKYFDVKLELLVGKNCFGQASLARNYLWYILHYDCNLSINTIAKEYERTPRRVKRVVSKTKYLVTTQRIYKEHYEKIKQL
jgi:chromosomal replication initiation ATPase DnaA